MPARFLPENSVSFLAFSAGKILIRIFSKRLSRIATESDSPSEVKISGSDISEQHYAMAKNNVARAGLNDAVSLETADFKNLRSAEDGGYVFLNPPYGQRIQPEEIDNLYSMIGTTLKHNFPGNTAWLITSNKESLKHIGLKPKEKHILFNGALNVCCLNMRCTREQESLRGCDITDIFELITTIRYFYQKYRYY